MRLLGLVLRPFYVTWIVLTFLASILIAFPFFFVAGIWNNQLSRKFIWQIVHYWSKGWLLLIGLPIKTYGDFPRNGKYVIIANHVSYLDTINIYAAIPEYFRTLAKKEMAGIPLFGFIYRRLTILVDRSSVESRSKSMRLMYRLLKTECHISVFPEGGFNQTEEPLMDFFDGAFRLAISTQTTILPMIFLDTIKRWHYDAWWMLSPGRNRTYFLAPVSVAGYSIQEMEILKQKLHKMMKEKIMMLKATP